MNLHSVKQFIGRVLYVGIGKHLPMSGARVSLGARRFRQFCAHLILEDCGEWVNIDKGVTFATDIKLGNGSGIGANCSIPTGVSIGENVMMGIDILMFTNEHRHDDEQPAEHRGQREPPRDRRPSVSARASRARHS